MKVPKNRDMVQKLPPKQILLGVDGQPWKPPASVTVPTGVQGVVLLDGWNNPIIFVPGGTPGSRQGVAPRGAEVDGEGEGGRGGRHQAPGEPVRPGAGHDGAAA